MNVATRKLQRNFSTAARTYDERAQFQHIQTGRVLDAALMLFPESASVADIGCGTGYFAQLAHIKRPEWNILGIDIAQGMCDIAATRCTAITADAARLPLAAASVDAAVSSLCYQWVENQQAAFAELARILKPGGRAVIASLGEGTLEELRTSAAAANLPLNSLRMRDFESCKTDLIRSGLQISLADKRLTTEYYASVAALLNSMRGIGAGNNFSNTQRKFTPPKAWGKMIAEYEKRRTPEGIPATWEHHFFILHKPL